MILYNLKKYWGSIQSFYLIELYCIVDYDRNCYAKFHKDCMFEIIVISLLRRLMIIFKHLKKVLGPMFDTELLQHSKLNCTV